MTATLRISVSSVQKESRTSVSSCRTSSTLTPSFLRIASPCFTSASPRLRRKPWTVASKPSTAATCICSLWASGTARWWVSCLSPTPSIVGRKKTGLPVLAFIKGERQVQREEGTVTLLAELDADGPKYKRFGNVIELQKEVRAALVKLLQDRFGIAPTN